MNTFDPRQKFSPERDARAALHRQLARAVEAAPTGNVCWVIAAPRRAGKTWALRALEGLVSKAHRYDIHGEPKIPQRAYNAGSTLLLDEPGAALARDAEAFVERCRLLEKRGVRVVVAVTPGELERLQVGCAEKGRSVERSCLFLSPLDEAEQQHLARTEASRRWLERIPDPWRRNPFLLESTLACVEATPSLPDDPATMARTVIAYVERAFRYTWFVACEGLSQSQRTVVRALLRGAHVTDAAALELLDRVGVVWKGPSGRFSVTDPILASTLSPLRIHHISDVHVGPKSLEAVDMKSTDPAPRDAVGPGFVRDRYVEHLSQCRTAGTAPHVLVCSGDCVEYANAPEQFTDFAAWLADVEAELAPHPAIPTAQRTLLVGGNHDVDWNLAARGDRDRHNSFAAVAGARPHPGLHLDPAHRPLAEVSFAEAGVSFALLGSAEYGGTVTGDPFRAALLASLDAAARLAPTADAGLMARMDALRERLTDDPLTELRSVLDALCPDPSDKERREKIENEHWKVMRIDPGLVDDRDLARLRTHNWRHPVRIAVLHHPVSPLPDTEVARFGGLLNAGAVKEALLMKGFHLVLHGHVHRGWFAQERQWGPDGVARTLAVASAPTLGSRETSKDQGFNEVEVARDYDDKGHVQYCVVVRRYVRDGSTWRPDGAEMVLDPIPA